MISGYPVGRYRVPSLRGSQGFSFNDRLGGTWIAALHCTIAAQYLKEMNRAPPKAEGLEELEER